MGEKKFHGFNAHSSECENFWQKRLQPKTMAASMHFSKGVLTGPFVFGLKLFWQQTWGNWQTFKGASMVVFFREISVRADRSRICQFQHIFAKELWKKHFDAQKKIWDPQNFGFSKPSPAFQVSWRLYLPQLILIASARREAASPLNCPTEFGYWVSLTMVSR